MVPHQVQQQERFYLRESSISTEQPKSMISRIFFLEYSARKMINCKALLLLSTISRCIPLLPMPLLQRQQIVPTMKSCKAIANLRIASDHVLHSSPAPTTVTRICFSVPTKTHIRIWRTAGRSGDTWNHYIILRPRRCRLIALGIPPSQHAMLV